MTPCHAKFHAHEPSRDGVDGVDRFGRARLIA